MRTAPALVALILLSLCAMPCGKDAAADSAQTKAIQDAAQSSDGAASKADYTLKDTGTTAPPTKNALHRTAEAGAKTADVSADARQLRESEHWVNYYARAYRVPVELVEAIIDQESGWNPHAVSRKGAVGLMQLMPATATRFGVRNRFRVDENIRGGVAYLAWLSDKCNGDVRLMTAAYYGGEGQVSPGRPEQSSPEVQAYVNRVAQKYRERRKPITPNLTTRHKHNRAIPVAEVEKSSRTRTNVDSGTASHLRSIVSTQRPCDVDDATDTQCVVFR